MIEINLGSNNILELTPIPNHNPNALFIDTYLEKIKYLIEQLEFNCVADCCGIDAFNFTKDHIKKIKPLLNLEDIKLNIQLIESELSKTDEEIFVSYRINHNLHRKDFFKLLNHVKMHLEI